MMDVIGVQGERIDDAMPLIREHFDKFTASGVYDEDRLREDIRNKARQCWVVTDGTKIYAVILTHIANDRKTTCQITHLAGERFQKWHHLLDRLEQWAKATGCERFEAVAHPAWERMGKAHGYKKSHIILEKDL